MNLGDKIAVFSSSEPVIDPERLGEYGTIIEKLEITKVFKRFSVAKKLKE